MTKDKKTYDLRTLLIDNKDNSDDLSFEQALSKGLLFALQKFSKTSETSRREAKDISILSQCNETIKEICETMIKHRKQYKRKRSKEWLLAIRYITTSVQKEKIKDGILPFLHRG